MSSQDDLDDDTSSVYGLNQGKNLSSFDDDSFDMSDSLTSI